VPLQAEHTRLVEGVGAAAWNVPIGQIAVACLQEVRPSSSWYSVTPLHAVQPRFADVLGAAVSYRPIGQGVHGKQAEKSVADLNVPVPQAMQDKGVAVHVTLELQVNVNGEEAWVDPRKPALQPTCVQVDPMVVPQLPMRPLARVTGGQSGLQEES
jgi:hypothetical protein